MNAIVVFVLVGVASYLQGSIPWGLLIGRWSRGVDVRQTGSGNIGSSNVLRTAGAKAAGLALVLDVARAPSPSSPPAPSPTSPVSPKRRAPACRRSPP